MRNLKRALSLALASVMVLGLMVVGTGASYKDVTSEQNQEAIEVLQTVGIMTGDDQGNFNPSAPVSRNEMAVVMANLMDYRVATYAGTSPFTDVPTWAEPYVAACWTNGITSGYTATTYGGSDSVTTAQAALMLMKALGYFQYASDFGDDWMLATTRQGNKIDLFEDVDSGVREAMTRNDLAQLVLNTLKSGMVEPDDNTIKVDTGDVKVEAGKVNYNYITSGETYSAAIKNLGVAGTVVNSGTRIVELGEKLYKGDLKMDDRANVRDDFGRPGTEWKYKTDVIGTYADAPIATYTAKVTQGTLWTLIGGVDNVATLTVYANGDGTVSSTKNLYFQKNSSDASGKGTAAESGKGFVTEVYTDNDNNVTIVTYGVYVAQANGDFNEKSGTLKTTTLTRPGAAVTVGTLDEEDFADLNQFADEDYILYTYAAGEVQSVAKATVVTGTVDAYSYQKNVTLDGTKYEYGLKIDAVGTNNSKDTTYMVGAQAAVVLDPYGYVLYVDDAAMSVGNYLYVNGLVKKSGLGNDYIATAYFYDGTKKTITIDTVYDASRNKVSLNLAPVTISNGDGHEYDGWYSYSVSGDEYTLRRAATNSYTTAPSENIWAANGVTAASTTIMDSEHVKFINSAVAGTLGNPSGDNDTIFIVDDGDDVTVYTGIKNAPDISTKASYSAGSSKGVVVSYMLSKDTAGNFASLVFVDASVNSANVNIDGGSVDEVLYVLDKDTSYVNKANGDTINVWNVILNGEKTTIESKSTSPLTAYTMYYKVKVDSDGRYDATAFPGTSGKYVNETLTKASDVINYSAGTISLGGYAYSVTDDTEIVLVLNDTKADGTKENGNKLGYVNATTNNVMTDPDAKYEYHLGITAKSLENLLKGWKVDATFYGVKTDVTGLKLDTLYVVVTDIA